MGMSDLADFVAAQMKEREMSARQFADFVGTSSTTINNLLKPGGYPFVPSVELLIKLAKATHTDFFSLVLLAFPEASDLVREPPTGRLMADQFERLPDDVKAVVAGILSQWATRQKE
jgi:transcriptional regulator with XRE-family HTH domain